MEKGVALAVAILFFLLAHPVHASEDVKVDILHYDLNVLVNQDEHRFDVAALVKLRALEDGLTEIEFLLNDELQIASVKSDGASLNFEREGYSVTVFLDSPVSENKEIELYFEYFGIADVKPGVGESVWGYVGPEGSYMIYEANWYPMTWTDRSTATISLKVPRGETGVTVGELVGTFDNGEYSEFVWEVDTPARGISFAVGDYVTLSTYFGHIPVVVYAYPEDVQNTEKTLKKSKDILDFYSSTLTDYPYKSLKIVEIPDFFMGGHGDQGMIMLYASIFKKEESTGFLAHEIAHNWWGALVSAEGEHSLQSSEGFGIFSKTKVTAPRKRKDHNLWLLEGFATYSSIMYEEHVGGKGAMMDYLDEVKTEYLGKIETYPDEPIINVEEEYGKRGVYHAVVYGKGALVLHMLKYVVGDETFQKIMNTYMERYGGKSATIEDFQSVSEEVSGRNLGWFFDEWVRDTILPDYAIDDVVVKKNSPGYEVSFTILQAGDVAKMPVEITLHTQGADITKMVWVDKESKQVSITTSSKPVYLEVDMDHWILESDRSNNHHVISYPLNMLGVKLLLKEIGNILN